MQRVTCLAVLRPGFGPVLWLSSFLLVSCSDDRPIAGGAGGGYYPDHDDGTSGDGTEDGTSEPSSETGDDGDADDTDSDATSEGDASDDGTSDGDDQGDGGATSDEVPDNDYCREAADWDPAWSAKEEEVLALVNDLRESGVDCPGYGSFGPAPPFVMEPALRCAARMHSKDMADRGFFDHTNPDGEGPGDRFRKAEYQGSSGSENIAMGSHAPSHAVDQWLASGGHCANMMKASFTELGVGFYPASQVQGLWTQALGTP